MLAGLKPNDVYEILVIDDGSTDDSLDKIRAKYPSVKIIKNEENKGAAYSRNKGIKSTTGEYILFVDNDIFVENDFVKNISMHASKYDLIYPKIVFEDGKLMMPKSEKDKTRLKISPIFLIKRNSLNKLDDLFDEKYTIYDEDTDFFLRCFYFDFKQKYLEHLTVIHKVKDKGTSSRRYYLECRNKIYFLIKLSIIPKKVRLDFESPSINSIFILFLIGILNKDIFESKLVNSPREFIRLLSETKRRIAKNRFELIYLFIKALLWNLFNIRDTIRKRRKLKKFIYLAKKRN